MSHAKVILVDGPFRGEIRKVDSPYQSSLVLPIPRPVSLTEGFDPFEAAFSAVCYQIHRLKLFGERLLIGSASSGTPRDSDLRRWPAMRPRMPLSGDL